jgi:hypothetical protein
MRGETLAHPFDSGRNVLEEELQTSGQSHPVRNGDAS